MTLTSEGMDADQKREMRDSEREIFFDELPLGELTAEEEALKEALYGAVSAFGGIARMNKISDDGNVKQAKAAFIPKGHVVSFGMWIQRRLGEEYVIEPDPNAVGNQVISFADPSLITGEKPQASTSKGKTAAGKSKGKGKEGKSKWAASLGPQQTPLRSRVTATVNRHSTPFQGKGFGCAGGFAPAMGMSPVVRSPGMAPYYFQGKGKGAIGGPVLASPFMASKGKRALGMAVPLGKSKGKGTKGSLYEVKKELVRREQFLVGQAGAGETKAGLASADREAFFESLPSDNLTQEEVALLDALIEKVNSMGGSGRLNTVVVDPSVKQAKLDLLPNKSIGLSHWIQRRVATSLTVKPDPVAPDNQIVSIASESQDLPTSSHTSSHEQSGLSNKREQQTAERDELFASFPDGYFSTEEEELMNAMTEKIRSLGGSGRLNKVVQDATVIRAKRALLGKVAGVTYWIEQRASSAFSLEDDPTAQNNQIVSLIDDSMVHEPSAKRQKIEEP